MWSKEEKKFWVCLWRRRAPISFSLFYSFVSQLVCKSRLSLVAHSGGMKKWINYQSGRHATFFPCEPGISNHARARTKKIHPKCENPFTRASARRGQKTSTRTCCNVIPLFYHTQSALICTLHRRVRDAFFVSFFFIRAGSVLYGERGFGVICVLCAQHTTTKQNSRKSSLSMGWAYTPIVKTHSAKLVWKFNFLSTHARARKTK